MATRCFDFREGAADFGHQVRYEQQHGIRSTLDELRRADHRNIGPGHTQALLGWRGVSHRRQECAVDIRLAQHRYCPGCGAISDDGRSSRSFGQEACAASLETTERVELLFDAADAKA